MQSVFFRSFNIGSDSEHCAAFTAHLDNGGIMLAFLGLRHIGPKYNPAASGLYSHLGHFRQRISVVYFKQYL